MRISRLAFKGVGPFEDATFDLPEPEGPGELVLFEGPNGSGKTTVVEAIAVVAGVRSGGILWDVLRRRIHGDPGLLDASVVHGDATARVTIDRAEIRIWDQPDPLRVCDLLGRISANHSGSLSWAAFSFAGHQRTAGIETAGPQSITVPPLSGALSFGRADPASMHLGQLLTNLENERTKALIYASEQPDAAQRDDLTRLAAARREAIRRFETVLSDVLDRRIKIEFSVHQEAPRVRFDGEEIPLDLLGEGMRSTFSWLADLLVRLERVPWEDRIRSPIDQDFWLILDEIDESLHPTMQARVLPALRKLLPNARIYATTHSPFVVASVGEGTVFSIRPDADHRVRGQVEARRLRPGQSLELVASEIFDAPSEFVDEDTRAKLEAHERDVRSLEQRVEIDWDAFVLRRRELMGRNDEVRTAVSMQELPVRQAVQRALRMPPAPGSAWGGSSG